MIALTQDETAVLRSVPVVALIQEAHRRGLTVHTSTKPLLNEDRSQLANTQDVSVLHSTQVAQEAQRNHG